MKPATTDTRIVTINTPAGPAMVRADAVTMIGSAKLPGASPLELPRSATVVSGVGFQIVTDQEPAAVAAAVWNLPTPRAN